MRVVHDIFLMKRLDNLSRMVDKPALTRGRLDDLLRCFPALLRCDFVKDMLESLWA